MQNDFPSVCSILTLNALITYLPAILSLSKGGPLVFVEPDRSDLVHLLLHGDLKKLIMHVSQSTQKMQ